MIDHLATLRERPVWREPSAEARERFRRPLPAEGRGLAAALEDFERFIQPYANGNIHPLFMGWAQGAGTPVGMVAEMLAAGLNSNCGGRNHIALDVERQIAAWMARGFRLSGWRPPAFSSPARRSPISCRCWSRASMRSATSNVRKNGLKALEEQLVAYASREAHNCVRQAMELAGLGARHLRLIEFGRRPLAAASTSCAAPSPRIAPRGCIRFSSSARRARSTRARSTISTRSPTSRSAEDLWFHIDGAFGALAVLSPALQPLVKGLERADFGRLRLPQMAACSL